MMADDGWNTCAQGGFRPLNRLGMESNTSPWLKMTFETCLHFLSSAAQFGDIDRMTSPAARLVNPENPKLSTASPDFVDTGFFILHLVHHLTRVVAPQVLGQPVAAGTGAFEVMYPLLSNE